MDNRREPLIVTALVAGLIGLGAAQPAAEADSRPTLAVVSFKGPDIPPETGDAMADELATQFVETGRYRVLHRNWLMAAAGAGTTSIAALREAAAAANIKYLVMGEAQYGMSLGARSRNILFFDVRVISVATGEVVRTAAGRTTASPPRNRRPSIGPTSLAGANGFLGPGPAITMARPQLPGSAGSLLRVAATAAAVHRAKHRSTPGVSTPAGGWQQAMTDIAKAINLTGDSR